jgi:serine/threonine-protein kinase HipA
MNKCLYCYKSLEDGERDFHQKCAKQFFGVNEAPILDFGKEDLKAIAQQIVIRSVALTGVQAKLSLALEKIDRQNSRLTIVGLWGDFILKPPSDFFTQLPENEDLTMKLAVLCGIKTAEHSLIRLASGELAYLTKRFDRKNGTKIHVEDFCQLTETLTEHKYRSSMEKVGKTLKKFSTNSGLDALSFFEETLFCYLTGNADMHLKNFSLIKTPSGEIQISPAYDLVSTKLAMPQDLEEMALTINGKKNKLKKLDFDKLAEGLGINPKARENVYSKIDAQLENMKSLMNESFLDKELQGIYQELITKRGKIFRNLAF